MKTKKELLQEALTLLGPNGEHWVGHCPYEPGKHCALTATAKAEGRSEELRSFLYKALHELGFKKYDDDSISRYNDSHTFPEVKALFERAIELAP